MHIKGVCGWRLPLRRSSTATLDYRFLMSAAAEAHAENERNDRVTRNKLVVILAGPTAVGKSDVAAKLCAQLRGIIVSADSVQAYRGVQIGANKPDKAEMEQTPHLLVDVADHMENYNAAGWRRDAMYCIQRLVDPNTDSSGIVDEIDIHDPHFRRNRGFEIEEAIQRGLRVKQYRPESSVLPVVVGGTMMYLQWLVHGRPDALRPTDDALRTAAEIMGRFEIVDDWEGAAQYVRNFGEAFSHQASKLCGQDWYRLRRILEVALTVQESSDATLVDNPYSGEREGSLKSLGYDVRCFFLCPDDRMKHTAVIDKRCEQMVQRGLLKETADLQLARRLPDMAAKAIGYRQALDYLERSDAKDEDEIAFQEFLDMFTTATRRYAKKQMQWFRKDSEFVFVPVAVSIDQTARIDSTTETISHMISMSRESFDAMRESQNSVSALTRMENEMQGKQMKFYQTKRHVLKQDSVELALSLREADHCTNRIHATNSTSM
jgi:tRNA dimethylallyltransferase